MEVNSGHRRKPKNVRRNIDLKVQSMDGDEYLAWFGCNR